jgi:hypothetical protein
LVWSTKLSAGSLPGGDEMALPVGARVWVMREGRSGRVVACAQGGLLYRVRLDGGDGAVLVRTGGDLLRLHDEAPD